MSRTSHVLAVLMLALTIAASTAASAVMQAAVTTSLGVPDPAGLLNIEPLRELPGRGAVVFNESYPNYLRLRDRKYEAFSAVTCIIQSVVGWEDGSEVRPLQASRVTASFFAVAGVTPLAGQPFTEAHDGPTPSPVAVISYRLWQQAFAGDPQAVGKSIRLAGVPHTVLAVMPPNFGIPAPTDVWTPLGNPMSYLQPTARIFNVFARLRPGESMAKVHALTADLTRFTIKEDSVNNRDYYYRARPLRDALVGTSAPVIWLVQIGAALLFVLAVSNVWALFLAMVIERGTETAVRRALGASTLDIIWLLVRRSFAIALPAGAFGALLAWAVLPLIRQLHPNPSLGYLLSAVRLDTGVLAATIGLTLVATIGIVLLPAWHAIRQPAVSAIGSIVRGGTLSRPAARWLRALVTVQTTITVVVLFAAVVSGVSFWKQSSIADGFETDGRMVARVMLPDARYGTHPPRVEFANRLTDALGQVPDILSFGFTTTLPVGDLMWGGRFFPELPDGSMPAEPITLHLRRVSPGYLQTIGIPLMRGRHLSARDDGKSPLVAVISQAAAARLFAGQDALGKHLRRFTAPGGDAPQIEVVGIAGDTMDAGYAAPLGETIYVPFAQMSVARMSIVVRPHSNGDVAIAAVRRALKQVDPTIALNDVASLQSLVDDARAIPRLQMLLLAAFAVVALGLTSLGSYGVMNQLVASRQRELAVRLAIGATPLRVRGMVLGQNARLALIGIALGLVASWQTGRLLAPLVFGVSSTSPVALAVVAVITLGVTAAAAFVPAARAARVDVMRRLRT